jgi:uncharacterized protein
MFKAETFPESPSALEAPPAERLPSLDLLRGIAILGILPANVPLFAGTIGVFAAQPIGPTSPADHAAMSVTVFAVFGKFVTLLAMLFGAGLALQVWKADQEGRPFAAQYIRRMAILFLIGLVHGLLLWFGDILSSYAIVALLGLIFARFSPRLVLWTAVGCLLVVATWLTIMVGATMLTGTGLADTFSATGGSDEAGEFLADLGRKWQQHIRPDNQARIWREGSFGEMVLNRAIYLAVYIFEFWLVVVWFLLGCFLIGIYLLRRGVFHQFESQRPFVRKMVIAGLLVGVPLQLIAAGAYLVWPESGLHLVLPYTIGGLPLALAYLGLGLYWSHSGKLAGCQHAIQAVGRTALSNYLFQSVLCNLIYYRWGLALYGQQGHAANLAIIVGVWLVEIGLSVLWLRYFPIGPIEWLWRSLAEGRARPLRRTGP